MMLHCGRPDWAISRAVRKCSMQSLSRTMKYSSRTRTDSSLSISNCTHNTHTTHTHTHTEWVLILACPRTYLMTFCVILQACQQQQIASDKLPDHTHWCAVVVCDSPRKTSGSTPLPHGGHWCTPPWRRRSRPGAPELLHSLLPLALRHAWTEET